MTAVGILYVIDLDILVIYRHVMNFRKCQAIEPVGQVEDCRYTVFKPEIRLELLLVQVELGLAVLFGPVREIP